MLFLLPVLLLAAMLELGLRRIPNDYSYKSHWLETHISEVKILNFGSSHGYFGINPNAFSKQAFNAAHVSQTIGLDHFIFSKYIGEADSIEYLILPVSYSSLNSNVMIGGKEKWRNKKYMFYYDCPYRKCSFKNLEIWDGKLHNNCLRLYRFFFHDIDEVYVDALGWCKMEGLDWEDDGEEAAKRHTASIIPMDRVEKNIEMIQSIINVCQAKDIEIILLTLPAYETYREKLNNKQLSIVTNSCDSLAAFYKNVVYFNLLSDCRFNRNDFFNSDHLNEQGATKLSLLLQQVIDSLDTQKKQPQYLGDNDKANP